MAQSTCYLDKMYIYMCVYLNANYEKITHNYSDLFFKKSSTRKHNDIESGILYLLPCLYHVLSLYHSHRKYGMVHSDCYH